MSYSYSYAYTDGLEEVLAVNGISAAFSSLIHFAVFVFTAISLYTLAKNRGIRNPWLAWIPVANHWVLGSLSDQYRYVVKGQIKSKRKALIALAVVEAVLYWVFLVATVLAVGHLFFGLTNQVSEQTLMNRLMVPGLLFLGTSLPLAGVAIAKAVIYYMALFDVYLSCDPRNSVMYLVLSIVFTVTKPFFLFFNRNKDEGMPPRRETVYEAPPVFYNAPDVSYEEPVHEGPVHEEPACVEPVNEEPAPWEQSEE